jgi:hypothetical protein
LAAEELITEIEGPRGTAEIFEVTLPNERIIEVEYVVVFQLERRSAPSLGEAHLLANQLTGMDEDA